MDEKLQKQISDTIGGDLPQDEIAEALEQDEEAHRYQEDLATLEDKLGSWQSEEPPKEYWRAFTKRVSGQIASAEPSDGDEELLEPPAPDEPGEGEGSAAEEDGEAQAQDEDDLGLGSLAALAGISTVPSVSALDESRPAPAETKEDSGLIDLGALRAAEEETKKKEEAPPLKETMAVAAPSSALERGEGRAQPSPALASAPSEGKGKGIYYLVGVLVIALVVVAVIAFRPRPPEEASDEETLAQATTETTGAAEAIPPTSAPREPAEPAETEERGSATGGETDEGADENAPEEGDGAEGVGEDGAGEAAALNEPAEAAARDVGNGTKVASAARRDVTGPPAATEPEPRAKAEPAPEPAAPARSAEPAPDPTKGGTTGDLDDLLARATGSGSAPAKAPTKGDNQAAEAVASAVGGGGGGADPGLPNQPSRSQVRRAMGSVSGQVMACRALVDSTTRVNATVVVSNSGAVQSASVSGGSPQLQQCVQRAVRRARFPRFSEPTFTVTYPFVLSPP